MKMWYTDRLNAAQQDAVENALREVPVKLGKLASALGIDVRLASLPPGVSGEIRRLSSGQYRIRINRDEPPTRQRFTLAHEIAHYLLHRDAIGGGMEEDVLYRSDRTSNRQEIEANKMAAEILVPSEHLKRFHNRDINEIAAEFNVSPRMMKIRTGRE